MCAPEIGPIQGSQARVHAPCSSSTFSLFRFRTRRDLVAEMANGRAVEADGATDCAAQSEIFAVFFRANRESQNGDRFATDSLHRQEFAVKSQYEG